MSGRGLAKLTPLDVARQVFGADVTLDEADYLLWNHTSHPFGPNLEAYRGQLLTSKLTWEGGQRPCDGCGSPAARYICDACRTPSPNPESPA